MGFSLRNFISKVAPIAGGALGTVLGGGTPVGTALGALGGSAIGGLFEKKPKQTAQPYLDQIPQQGQQLYNPFIQQGQEAYNQLSPAYIQMLQNPQALYDNDLANYRQSEQYKQFLPQLNQSLENTAAAGGYVGTQGDQEQRAALIHRLMSGDLGQYLQNIGGIRTSGLQGLENAAGRGFQGAYSLADYLGNANTNRANFEYQSTAQEGLNQNDFLQTLLKSSAKSLGDYYENKNKKDEAMKENANKTGQQIRTIQTNLPQNSGFSPTTSYGATGYMGRY